MHNTSSALLGGNINDKEIWVRLGLAHSKNPNLTAALEATKANQIDQEDLEMVANRITILKDLANSIKQKCCFQGSVNSRNSR